LSVYFGVPIGSELISFIIFIFHCEFPPRHKTGVKSLLQTLESLALGVGAVALVWSLDQKNGGGLSVYTTPLGIAIGLGVRWILTLALGQYHAAFFDSDGAIFNNFCSYGGAIGS
jgi:hypothetical protein